MAFIGQTISTIGAPDLVIHNVPCDPSVIVGDWVRMSGGIAIKAIADDVDNSNVLGLVEFKGSSTTANVRVLGVSEAIFTGLDETKEYFLSDSTAGEMTTTPPTADGHVIVRVGQPYTSDRFLVLKGIRIVRSTT